MKNLAMLPSYVDYIFVHLIQKVRLRPELSPKFLSTSGPNPARTRPEKPGPTYNSEIPLPITEPFENERLMSFSWQQQRIASSVIEPGTSKVSITHSMLNNRDIAVAFVQSTQKMWL